MGDGKFAQRTIAILQVGSSADFAWLEQFGFWSELDVIGDE